MNEQVNGFDVQCRAVLNDITFIGTYGGGLYRVYGETQERVMTFPQIIVWGLAATQNGVLVAATPIGIIRSFDVGQFWNEHSNMEMVVLCLTEQDGVVRAGTYEQGEFQSSNDGEAWAHVPSKKFVPNFD